MIRDIEYKYAQLLSSKLPRFKVKQQRPYLANFRCPICGDSQKNSRIARGFINEYPGMFFVKCHNCNYGTPLGAFIERIDPDLFKEYKFEQFKSNINYIETEKVDANPIVTNNVTLKGLAKISTLPITHPAKRYVDKRQIPANTHFKLFYTPNFSEWINTKIPGKLSSDIKLDPRLVLPLLNRKGDVFGVQGRDLTGKSKQRYITIRFDESTPKIFGLDTFNPNYKTYIVEGPIDSLFLPNALAMVGSDVKREALTEYANADKERLVFIYDNEPRNKEVTAKLAQTIKLGYNVCIWPSFIKPKDINDMYLAGLDPQKIIDDHTYNGMKAELVLAEWKKC